MGLIGKVFGKQTPPDQRFLDMRRRLVTVSPVDIGLAHDPAAPIFGVVMETGIGGAVALFACLADGTVSVYLSNGTVIIGGGQHDSVRAAAGELLALTNKYATEYIAAAQPGLQPELPRDGQVHFSLLTQSGPYSVGCRGEDLEAENDPFANLYVNCHAVMSEVREIEQRRGHSAGS